LISLEFIVKYLEIKTQSFGFEPQWLLETLFELRIKLTNLLDLYHKLYKSREYGTSWPRKPQHLLRVIAFIINKFAENPTTVNISERLVFSTNNFENLILIPIVSETDVSLRPNVLTSYLAI
jgi:hypothetical protein